jgi:hypothetical protein
MHSSRATTQAPILRGKPTPPMDPSPAGVLGAPYSTGTVAGTRPSPAFSTTDRLELSLVRAGMCSSALLLPHLEGKELPGRSFGASVASNALKRTVARPPWSALVLLPLNRALKPVPFPAGAPPRRLVMAVGDLPRSNARPSSAHSPAPRTAARVG